MADDHPAPPPEQARASIAHLLRSSAALVQDAPLASFDTSRDYPSLSEAEGVDHAVALSLSTLAQACHTYAAGLHENGGAGNGHYSTGALMLATPRLQHLTFCIAAASGSGATEEAAR
ncbi:hypothetical protein ACWGIR_30980 [Streptomyces albidoflavus]